MRFIVVAGISNRGSTYIHAEEHIEGGTGGGIRRHKSQGASRTHHTRTPHTLEG